MEFYRSVNPVIRVVREVQLLHVPHEGSVGGQKTSIWQLKVLVFFANLYVVTQVTGPHHRIVHVTDLQFSDAGQVLLHLHLLVEDELVVIVVETDVQLNVYIFWLRYELGVNLTLFLLKACHCWAIDYPDIVVGVVNLRVVHLLIRDVFSAFRYNQLQLIAGKRFLCIISNFLCSSFISIELEEHNIFTSSEYCIREERSYRCLRKLHVINDLYWDIILYCR